MTSPRLSVVIPTRNPDLDRLRAVLASLEAQTLPHTSWDVCVVDNASSPALLAADLSSAAVQPQLIREPAPGLLAARLAGLRATRAPYVVFIDDDTLAAPNFLSAAVAFMDARPRVATAGGKILPRYASPPPDWIQTVDWVLAVRDNGDAPLEWSLSDGSPFPSWTPIGAGLLVRRSALEPNYFEHVDAHAAQIARTSWHGQGAGGVEDKDLVLHCLRAGWATGYSPDMVLTHLIPESRLRPEYFERMLPAVQRLWARTLHAHGLDLHPPVAPASLALRKLKAWFAFRAWRSVPDRLQWLSSCGYLEGLAANARETRRYPSPNVVFAPPFPPTAEKQVTQ